MDSLKRESRPDAWEASVSTGCLSKPSMNAHDTANVMYGNYRWIAARNNWNRTNTKIFPRLCGSLSSRQRNKNTGMSLLESNSTLSTYNIFNHTTLRWFQWRRRQSTSLRIYFDFKFAIAFIDIMLFRCRRHGDVNDVYTISCQRRSHRCTFLFTSFTSSISRCERCVYDIISGKLDRKQFINVPCQVCFEPDRIKHDGHPMWSVKKVAHCI